MKISKDQFTVLYHLAEVLNGNCGDSCPKHIGWNIFKDAVSPLEWKWRCEDCYEMFSFVCDPKTKLFRVSGCAHGCPCTHPKTKPVAIARLEEVMRNHLINRQF